MEYHQGQIYISMAATTTNTATFEWRFPHRERLKPTKQMGGRYKRATCAIIPLGIITVLHGG